MAVKFTCILLMAVNMHADAETSLLGNSAD